MVWQGEASTSKRLRRNKLKEGRDEALRYPGKRSRHSIVHRQGLNRVPVPWWDPELSRGPWDYTSEGRRVQIRLERYQRVSNAIVRTWVLF